MHAATQRLWETFWKSPEESVQMPFYVMGPHTSASETLSVRWLLDHNISSKSILPLLQCNLCGPSILVLSFVLKLASSTQGYCATNLLEYYQILARNTIWI